MNRERIAIYEINKLLHTSQNNKFYSDSELISALRNYMSEFLDIQKKQKKSWKVSDSSEFKEDSKTLNCVELAYKYNLSYQGAYYHLKKIK